MINDKNTDLHVHEIPETLPEKPDEHAGEPGDRITLLIQENETLRRTDRDYRILLDTLQEGVWAIDQNGYTTFVNPHMAEMLGYSVNDMQGKHLFDFMDDRGKELAAWNMERRKQGIKEQHEFEFIKKDGVRIQALLETGPITDEKGNYRGAIAGVTDITDRKTMERNLIEAKKVWEAIFRGIGHPAVILDARNNVIDANEAALQATGKSLEELRKMKCWQIFHGKQISKPIQNCPFERMKHSSIYEESELYLESFGGYYLVSTTPIVDSSGNLEKVIHVAVDITKRKQAEEKNRQLAAIVESSDDAIIGKTLNGIITSWNKGAEKTYGYMAQEIIGKPITMLVPPDRVNELPEILKKLSRGEHIKHYETTRVRKNGKQIQVFLTISPILDNEGIIIGASTIARDITENKKAEEALKESHFLLKDAMDLAHLTHWVYDIPTGIFTFNDQFYALYGTTAEREGGYQMPAEVYAREFVYPDDRHVVAGEVEKMIKTSDPDYVSRTEARIIRRDGEIRYVVVSLRIAKDAEGRTVKAYGANQDITERKKAEEALQFTRHAIDNVTDTMVTVDKYGHFADVNDAFCSNSGYTRDELLSRTVFDIDPDFLPEAWSAFWNKLKQSGSLTFETTHRSKDGRAYPVEITAKYFEYNGNEYHSALARDITERKRVDERIRWLASFPELNPEPVIEMDAQGMITFANAATLKTLRDLELPENPEVFVPEDKDEILRLLKKGTEPQIFREITLKNETYAENINLDQKLQVVRIYSNKITERKRADDSLKEAEEKYRNIFENSLEGIYQITREGHFKTANPAMANILGYVSVDDLVATVRNTAHQVWVDQERRIEYIRQLKENGSVRVFECEFFRKDKSRVWVSLNTRAIHGPDGAIIGSEGFTNDITARKTVEAALKESEEMFRNPVEQSPVGVFLIQDNILRYVNPKLAEMFGYTRDELLSISFEQIINTDDRQKVHELLTYWLKGKRNKTGFLEFRAIKKDGNSIDIEMYGSSMIYQRLPAIYGTLVDITERKQMEDTITRSLKEKEMLLKEIHHRVKNNMQVISSLVSMQARSIKDKSVQMLFNETQNRIQSIALVHEQLYRSDNISEIDYGEYLQKMFTPLFESYNVDERRVSIAIEAQKARITIEKAVPCSLIVNELLSNSLKHAFPGTRKGAIRIGFQVDEDTGDYILDYRDNGIGIPPGFDIFKTPSLGMKLVHGLTQQLSGTISLVPGEGVHFRIVFPDTRKKV